MDSDGPHASTQPDETAQASDIGLACNCCRKRKLRCSRETPICEHCRKTGQDCVYEPKRAKPGMKAGAIENLHKRLDILERTILRQQTALDNLRPNATPGRISTLNQDPGIDGQNVLYTLAQEICKLGNTSLGNPSGRTNDEAAHKRRRTDSDAGHQAVPQYVPTHPTLPDDTVLDEVVTSYFGQIHPWIPMIHEARFRKRLSDNVEKASMHLLLQAMILIASRHIPRRGVAESIGRLIGDQEELRDWVVAKATKRLSVENLQALIIICFHDIGDGEESRAWPLIGALTRMVEYLQLTVECEEADRLSFSRPYVTLHPSKDWTEAEERRRVFWCVFILDRFCSIATAWNTSLTSDDVNRRLPCDGITWRKEDPVFTPYFGIWDKSAGRIGNPIAFLPSHSIAVQSTGDEEDRTPSKAATSPGVAASIDMTTVGAFAYCIEATESLSRVMSYFLQQKVNTKDQNDLSSWLTRFKELDVRLVHWKMLLPQKWKVNIVKQSSRMDPNLTLAHITHNASMILLHQPIAFPPLDWTFRTRLPSFCSLDTCQAAAIEIATITDHYLRIASHTGPLANQFAFCVYIAARVLLLYWRYCSADALSPEFWLLTQSLEILAKRWAGPHQFGPRENLAFKYRTTLIDLHARCTQDETFAISISAYTTEVKHSKGSPPYLDNGSKGQDEQAQGPSLQTSDRAHDFHSGGPNISGLPTSLPQTAGMTFNHGAGTQYMLPNMVTAPYAPRVTTDAVGGTPQRRTDSVGSGELGMISQLLFDSQFADMDRVISFDDGIFGTELEGGCL